MNAMGLAGAASLTIYLLFTATGAAAELRAGVSRVSITPLEQGLATQLGGYGERHGKPAEGIHDTIWAKCLVFDLDGKRSALVTLDVCSVPLCAVEESLEKAALDGLSVDSVLMAASHTHAGIEGFSMDRRNIIGNPNVGVFDEAVLSFVTDRIAQGLQEATKSLEPVSAGSASINLPGMNRNRRGKDVLDDTLTVLRLDRRDGTPLAALVNFPAHGTIMTEKEMLISGGWSGNMQRTVEDLVNGVTCLYTNGAEGDVSPAGYTGGSRWEMAEQYGRRVGIRVADLVRGIRTEPVTAFDVRTVWVDLPKHQAPPGFDKITGDEYGITAEQLEQVLPLMLPSRAPLCALRVNGFQMITFPGEPVCSIGLAVKQAMRDAGIAQPCVAALTNDLAGYILTPEDYRQSGYEGTTSFYGDGLGPLLEKNACDLARQVAAGK